MKKEITISVVSALLTAAALWIAGQVRIGFQEAYKDDLKAELTAEIRTDEGLQLAIADRIVSSLPPKWVSGTGGEGDNMGLLRSRSIRFTKVYDSTPIRIGYTDNLRVLGSHSGCRWEILIGGQSCPSGKLSYTYYSPSGANPHRSRHVIGYCEGLQKGDYTVQVEVSQILSGDLQPGSCHTGWAASTWTLEVQEILAQ